MNDRRKEKEKGHSPKRELTVAKLSVFICLLFIFLITLPGCAQYQEYYQGSNKPSYDTTSTKCTEINETQTICRTR